MIMTGSIDYYFDSVSIDTIAIVRTMIIRVASRKNYGGEQNRQEKTTGINPFLSEII